MDAPGISMFAGAGSLHIDRSAQERLDEQEELEDQKRREKELQAKLLTAFDDLVEDDEPSSINSSQDRTGFEASRRLHTAHTTDFAVDMFHLLRREHRQDSELVPERLLMCRTIKRQLERCSRRSGRNMSTAKSSNPDTEKKRNFEQYYVPETPQIRNPPTYMETLNHMKDTSPYDINLPREPTPSVQRDYGHFAESNEDARMRYSPLGGGDAEENCYYPNEYRGHLTGQHNGVNSYEAKQQMLNFEQLQMMYDMRLKECQQLAEALESVKKQREAETDELRSRLAATTSERDQALLSFQKTQRSLATSKHQIVELEQEMSDVKDRLTRMTTEKERVSLELHSTAIGLQEAQQKLQQIQVSRTHETDALFRQQQDRHREECERMREDLERVKNRLVDKEREVQVLERRATEAERTKEEVLLEKGNVVNRLAAELEIAQSRLTTTDASAQRANTQVKELGTKLQQTAEELVSSRKEYARLRKEYEDWTNALKEILHDSTPDNFYQGGSPKSPAKLTALKELLSRYKQQTYQLNKLTEDMNKKDKKLEQCRRLEADLQTELENHKGIQTQLNSRLAVLQNKLELSSRSNGDVELLETYKQQNQQLQGQVTNLRSELETMESNYTELEQQLEQLKSNKSSRKSLEREANADLLRELDQLSTQLKDSIRENGELKSLYLQVCSARDSLTRDLHEARTKLTTAQKEKNAACEREKTSVEQLENEKQNTEKLMKEMERQKGELEEANRNIAEQQKEYTDKQKEFADKLYKYIKDESVVVSKEPEPCRNCEKLSRTVSQLEMQIQKYVIQAEMQGTNEALLKALREKAEYFEQYIVQRFKKIQSLCNVATNTEPMTNQHVTVNGYAEVNGHENTNGHKEGREHDDEESDVFATKTDLMMQEKQIREQIAEKYTLEIKTIEMNCTKKINELQKEHSITINKLKELLETKAQEVEVLKKVVVSERSKFNEIRQSKEKELTSALSQNRSLQEEYREIREKATEMKQMLEKSHTKNSKLKAEIEKKTKELIVEREKSARALTEMADQLRSLDSKATHIETQHDQLKDKYRNIKKTALVYKEYASKKDAHVESELERIKSHYEGEVARLHEKLQRLIHKRREIQVNERIGKMQSELEGIVSEVNSAT